MPFKVVLKIENLVHPEPKEQDGFPVPCPVLYLVPYLVPVCPDETPSHQLKWHMAMC